MPYITKEDRDSVDKSLGNIIPHDGGELQYIIATLIQRYYERKNIVEGGVRYRHMEQVMGALDGASREHYRMVVSPYEDIKIEENGGVYDIRNGEAY